MSLMKDILPDWNWTARGGLEASAQALSVTRAKTLDAVFALRGSLGWAVLCLGNKLITQNDNGVNETLNMIGIGLICSMGLSTIALTFFDGKRLTSVQDTLGPHVANPKHLYESIAVPALCFGCILAFAVLFPVTMWLAKVAPQTAPVFEICRALYFNVPWMSLTALWVAAGAYLRWREVSGSDGITQKITERGATS